MQVTLLMYEGFPSLYRGFLPTILGIFPYAALSFCSFETLKALTLQGRNNRSSLSPIESLVCGGIAGVASQTATYPLDTIRKVMQANTFLYYYNVKLYELQLNITIFMTHIMLTSTVYI